MRLDPCEITAAHSAGFVHLLQARNTVAPQVLPEVMFRYVPKLYDLDVDVALTNPDAVLAFGQGAEVLNPRQCVAMSENSLCMPTSTALVARRRETGRCRS